MNDKNAPKLIVEFSNPQKFCKIHFWFLCDFLQFPVVKYFTFSLKYVNFDQTRILNIKTKYYKRLAVVWVIEHTYENIEFSSKQDAIAKNAAVKSMN